MSAKVANVQGTVTMPLDVRVLSRAVTSSMAAICFLPGSGVMSIEHRTDT